MRPHPTKQRTAGACLCLNPNERLEEWKDLQSSACCGKRNIKLQVLEVLRDNVLLTPRNPLLVKGRPLCVA